LSMSWWTNTGTGFEVCSMASDPLANADVGTKATVDNTITVYGMDIQPEEAGGSDRETLSVDIADVHVVESEYHDTFSNVEITVESKVMKTIPSKWDETNEPVTEKQEKQARRTRWKKRIGSAIAFIIPTAFAVWLSMNVMEKFAQEVTVNGEPMTPPPTGDLLPALLLVMGLLAIIYAVAYGPRMV